jgi:hypothetical protein
MSTGRAVTIIAAMALLACVATAYAQQGAPTVLAPRDGDAIATRMEFEIRTTPRAVQVIWTDVFRADNGELIDQVPAIRHLSMADGTYRGAGAAPRVYLGLKADVRYVIHFRNGANEGDPETIVNAVPKGTRLGSMVPSRDLGKLEKPTVFAPVNDQRLGPRTAIRLKGTPGVLQVIWAEVIRSDTGEVVEQVPGIRHMPDADGLYVGAISTPRPRFIRGSRVEYRIHFRNGPSPDAPETVVVAYPK